MTFLIVLITIFLILDCLLLGLLILIQLPKKEAGIGMAFGGGAADALFGAGSGNALTKITKYTAIAFLVLSVILGRLQSNLHPASNPSDFTKLVDQKVQQTTVASPAPQTAPAAGNNMLQNMVTTTNASAPAPAGANSPK